MSKEQLTLLLGANMDGLDKIDPLVMGSQQGLDVLEQLGESLFLMNQIQLRG